MNGLENSQTLSLSPFVGETSEILMQALDNSTLFAPHVSGDRSKQRDISWKRIDKKGNKNPIGVNLRAFIKSYDKLVNRSLSHQQNIRYIPPPTEQSNPTIDPNGGNTTSILHDPNSTISLANNTVFFDRGGLNSITE